MIVTEDWSQIVNLDGQEIPVFRRYENEQCPECQHLYLFVEESCEQKEQIVTLSVALWCEECDFFRELQAGYDIDEGRWIDEDYMQDLYREYQILKSRDR